jgi:hypothetical protein
MSRQSNRTLPLLDHLHLVLASPHLLPAVLFQQLDRDLLVEDPAHAMIITSRGARMARRYKVFSDEKLAKV